MNYLAHLFLSPDHGQVRLGNLMGDFIKGNQLAHLPNRVAYGVKLHRAIDRFTDAQPEVKALKQTLSTERKRFSGIITDIVFDHLLATNWQEYSDKSLNQFAQLRYAELAEHKALMPDRMRLMVERMIMDNWLVGYQSPASVAGAINGVSRRIRFENKLLGAGEEVMPAIVEYQQAFLIFFPKLQAFVANYLEESGDII